MAAKKQKRPPRQIWVTIDPDSGLVLSAYMSRREALAARENGWNDGDERVVGPYVLAERVREK